MNESLLTEAEVARIRGIREVAVTAEAPMVYTDDVEFLIDLVTRMANQAKATNERLVAHCRDLRNLLKSVL